MKRIVLALLFFTPIAGLAQKNEWPVSLIPDSLTVNADAVVRLDLQDVKIVSQRMMYLHHKRVVTVFNEKGMRAVDAVAFYDNRQEVNAIEARVYDDQGNELRKIKRKDFRDQSVYDGFSIALDGRILFLDYTPPKYPITIVFDCETQTSNTAFIPVWQPISDFYVSTQKSRVHLTCPVTLGMHVKEAHFEKFPIQKEVSGSGEWTYELNQIPAQKKETYSPDAREIYPWVMFGIENFNLEKIDGFAKDWTEFGKWYYTQVLAGTDELPEETKLKMRALVSGVTDPIEKAKIIYNYVQQRSRYVSIQLGIGGWRPMPAKDVDRLGYGDCKALTNYTKSLLEAVGVTSYHTLLFAGNNGPKNIEEDVVSVQGNHMMLAVPDKDHYIWLECTSQTTPFGYQANFSDDRKVLVVKPDRTEIVHTKRYLNTDNTLKTIGEFKVDSMGDIHADLTMISNGNIYDQRARVMSKTKLEQEKYYKNYFRHLNNLKIESLQLDNRKNEVVCTEHIGFSTLKYAELAGNRMMIAVHAFHRFSDSPKRIRNRKTPFEFTSGFLNTDEIKIELPEGFEIESIPTSKTITHKFGTYQLSIQRMDEKHLLCKRQFSINSGRYPKEEYEDCRQFLEQVEKLDQSKVVLIKK